MKNVFSWTKVFLGFPTNLSVNRLISKGKKAALTRQPSLFSKYIIFQVLLIIVSVF